MSWAEVGKRCACIDADFSTLVAAVPTIDRTPMFNEALTIKEVVIDPSGVFLAFKEIPDVFPAPGGYCEVWWPIDQFRPLTARTVEQDMELFVPILDLFGEPA